MIRIDDPEAARLLDDTVEMLRAAERLHQPANLGPSQVSVLLACYAHLRAVTKHAVAKAEEEEQKRIEVGREPAELLQRLRSAEAQLANAKDRHAVSLKELYARVDAAQAKLIEAERERERDAARVLLEEAGSTEPPKSPEAEKPTPQADPPYECRWCAGSGAQKYPMDSGACARCVGSGVEPGATPTTATPREGA
jgi:hypothetical protein